MNNPLGSFLGMGWKFPVTVDDQNGRIMTVAYEEDIKEAIKIIIMTRKGERVMRPDFGCDVHDHQFDVITYSMLKQMESKVTQALIYWEPRITDVEVTALSIPEQPNVVEIHISYVVRTTNNPFNLVYPFYMTEGAI